MRWIPTTLWHSLSLVVMVSDPSLLHYMMSTHRKLQCICQGTCMLLSCINTADVRHRARSPLTFRHMALSKLLHAEDHTHAGVVIDGPEDMKPLVEAFAKQVCLRCYIPRHACEAFSSRKPGQSSVLPVQLLGAPITPYHRPTAVRRRVY